MFYAQGEHFESTETYFNKIEQFGLSKEDCSLLPEGTEIIMETTARKFEITVFKADGTTVSIDECGCIRRKSIPYIQ